MSSVTGEATMTSKGQITIPKEIRERLDLERGEKVSFELTEDGTVHLRKEDDPLDELRELREEVNFSKTDIETMQRESKRQWSNVE
ncbi:MAG TPA: AbrB/MazE/SpoVT family DNA-binding domain-containing protein [Halococcus sp.]|nr:AbrB/MazE/SpoVT family DNA-binding domain-containing protein [Halococcus sp.]